MNGFSNTSASVASEDIRLMCKDITAHEHRYSRLNEWEQGFIANVDDLAANNKRLSDKQMLTLSRLYEKATEHG